MIKYTKFFTHDCNAHDCPALLLLIDNMGMEGYGIYWMLIETLRDRPDYRFPLSALPALARRYRTDGERLMAVVRDYSLFEIDGEGMFSSPGLNTRMSIMDKTVDDKRRAGLRSAEARRRTAQPERQLFDTEAQTADTEQETATTEEPDTHADEQRPTDNEQCSDTQRTVLDKEKYNIINKNILHSTSSLPSPTAEEAEAKEAKATPSKHTKARAAPKDEMPGLMQMFNRAVQGTNIPRLACLRGERAAMARARLKEFGPEAFAQAVANAAASSYLNGGGNRGWVMDFGWMVRPNNFPKVLEGVYNNRITTENHTANESGTIALQADTERRRRELDIMRCMQQRGFGTPGAPTVRH